MIIKCLEFIKRLLSKFNKNECLYIHSSNALPAPLDSEKEKELALSDGKVIVNNKEYNVIGPRFKSTIVTRISTPFSKINSKIESNLTDRQNLPKALKVKIYKNSLFSTPLSACLHLL